MGLFNKSVKPKVIVPKKKEKPKPEFEPEDIEEDFDAALEDQVSIPQDDNISSETTEQPDNDKEILEHLEYALTLMVQKILTNSMGEEDVSEQKQQ